MNAKDIRKYNLITAIAEIPALSPSLEGNFSELAAIDFTTAFEVWEYKLGLCSSELGNEAVAANLEEKIFGVFQKASESRTRQLLCESLPLIKLIYQQCISSCSGHNLMLLTNLFLSSKLEVADEMLRCTRLNETGDLGLRMKAVVDSILGTYCARNGVKKAELSRKQATLLLEHIDKVKGPNKAILRQRIKEL